MTTDTVLPLQKDQIQEAAELLARVFFDDPVFVYLFNNPSERTKKSTEFFKLLAHYSLLYGELEATSSNMEGVAIWLPSDKAQKSLWSLLRSGMLPFLLKGGMPAIIKVMRMGRYPEEVHEKHVPFPHWYLQAIGVEPSLQGEGYAAMLMRNKLARFDMMGSVCYLETQNIKNVPMYKHYGFEVVEEYQIAKTPFLNWAMVRKPRF